MATTNITADHGKQEVIVEREFDYPRELVFRCSVHPELMVQWMGPRDMEMTFTYLEAKPGGSYRFTHINPNGEEFGFHGVYHEVKTPQLIIDTFEFEDMAGHVSLVTTKFEELPDGRSRVTEQTVFQSVADRDGMLQSGMREGVIESYERLDGILEKLVKEEELRETRRDHI
ncbi:SRPBCC family protein [Dehalogenimonas etheniformans]|uniref:ATPase n=1 Tax=Dehalogenimonas etheniformans TaxID=1536648 RepID=A0A2P5P6Z0_9CHLR|nr:SRPBCC family protein [Dehalogenimonas etheniformans]PPD58045.1 ATPase [Dehalogenimonas etheniformans]QNT75395.1 SRPBCC family protein [Dehalogenimonas etheniformans]